MFWRLELAHGETGYRVRPVAQPDAGDVLLCEARRAECRRLIALADGEAHRATADDVRKARVLAAAIQRRPIVVDAELPAECIEGLRNRVAEAARDLARAARLGP